MIKMYYWLEMCVKKGTGHMAKILIVDDDPEVLIMLQRLLETDGHEGVTAGSGLEALELIKLNAFDLVVADLRMPRMDGLELLREIKAIESALPVILVTAYASSETAIEAVRRGAFDYLFKPFKVKDFLTTVERALNADRSHTRAADMYSGDNPDIKEYLGSRGTESRGEDK